MQAPPAYNIWGISEKIEYTASLTHKESIYALDITPFTDVRNLAMSGPLTASKNRIAELANLKNNWDGYDAVSPDSRVIKNAYRFLDTLFSQGVVSLIDPNEIYPMPYGSIVFELYSNHGMVSLEIGKSKIGFFTEFNNCEDFSSNGEISDFKSIPANLQKAVRVLKYGK